MTTQIDVITLTLTALLVIGGWLVGVGIAKIRKVQKLEKLRKAERAIQEAQA